MGKELNMDWCPKCGGPLIRRQGGILDCVKLPCQERFWPGGKVEWMSNRRHGLMSDVKVRLMAFTNEGHTFDRFYAHNLAADINSLLEGCSAEARDTFMKYVGNTDEVERPAAEGADPDGGRLSS